MDLFRPISPCEDCSAWDLNCYFSDCPVKENFKRVLKKYEEMGLIHESGWMPAQYADDFSRDLCGTDSECVHGDTLDDLIKQWLNKET